MNLENLDAIIFDFGGVLININYNSTIEAFKRMGIEDFERLYSQANQSNLFNDFETGKIGADQFIGEIKKYLPNAIQESQIIDAWNSMINNVPSKVIELLTWLKNEKQKKIYLLSNTNSIHIDLAFKEWAKVSKLTPYEIFDKVYLSHEMHQRKPNPSIFEFVCKEQSLTPNQTLFIDDSIQHIEGAKSIGLQTYHLIDQEDLYTLFS